MGKQSAFPSVAVSVPSAETKQADESHFPEGKKPPEQSTEEIEKVLKQKRKGTYFA